jgi:hypothetical protein
MPNLIAPRTDGGLTLTGYCGCDGSSRCQLVATPLANGCLRLSYHGTAEHSIVLTTAQQQALIPLLRSDRAASR